VTRFIFKYKLLEKEHTKNQVRNEILKAYRFGNDIVGKARQILVVFKTPETRDEVARISKKKEKVRIMHPIFTQDDLTHQDQKIKEKNKDYMQAAHELGMIPRFFEGKFRVKPRNGRRRLASQQELDDFIKNPSEGTKKLEAEVNRCMNRMKDTPHGQQGANRYSRKPKSYLDPTKDYGNPTEDNWISPRSKETDWGRDMARQRSNPWEQRAAQYAQQMMTTMTGALTPSGGPSQTWNQTYDRIPPSGGDTYNMGQTTNNPPPFSSFTNRIEYPVLQRPGNPQENPGRDEDYPNQGRAAKSSKINTGTLTLPSGTTTLSDNEDPSWSNEQTASNYPEHEDAEINAKRQELEKLMEEKRRSKTSD
jgi:hypothetical protein